MEEDKKCDCLVYLAEYNYAGYELVHKSEQRSWKHGDDQYYFDFCPLCGEKIVRPQVESMV